MDKRLLIILVLLALPYLSFSTTEFTSGWLSDSSLTTGTSDVGTNAAPSVTNISGNRWIMVVGNFDDCKSFEWNTSSNSWFLNNTIVDDLTCTGIGMTQRISWIWNESGLTKLIIVSYAGNFKCYFWNYTQDGFTENSTDCTGLSQHLNSREAPSIFYIGSTKYYIAGLLDGTFVGYVWNGSSWVSNSTIIQGLGDTGDRATPKVFYRNNTYQMIVGDAAGTFKGFYLNESNMTWISNDTIVSGLGDIGTNSNAALFENFTVLSGVTFGLIGGRGDGLFSGFRYNSTVINFVSPTPTNGSITNNNPVQLAFNSSFLDISNCIIDIDGTNYSATLNTSNNRTCLYNITSPTDKLYTIKGWVNITGTWASTEEINYTFTFVSLNVSSCKTIISPAIYTLSSNATVSSGDCFTINSDNVKLDCAGFTIKGNLSDPAYKYGVYAESKNNVTIQNCFITEFNGSGVYFNRTNNSIVLNTSIFNLSGTGSTKFRNGSGVILDSVANVSLSNVNASYGSWGIYLLGSYTASSNVSISNVYVHDNRYDGLKDSSISSGSSYSNIVTYNNNDSGMLLYGDESFTYLKINNITVYGNRLYGVYLSELGGVTIDNVSSYNNNLAVGTSYGLYIDDAANLSLSNIKSVNDKTGVYITTINYNNDLATLSNISITNETDYGLYLASSNNLVLDNISVSNVTTASGLLASLSTNMNLSNIVISNSTVDMEFLCDSGSANINMENISIDGGGDGLYIESCDGATGNNITLSNNVDGNGLYVTQSKNLNLSNLEVSFAGGAGVYLSNNAASSIILTNISTHDNSDKGISAITNGYVTLENITSYNNNQRGILISSTSHSTFNNLLLYNNTAQGLDLTASNNNTITNVTLYNNAKTSTYEVYFYNSPKNNSLTNVLIYNTSRFIKYNTAITSANANNFTNITIGFDEATRQVNWLFLNTTSGTLDSSNLLVQDSFVSMNSTDTATSQFNSTANVTVSKTTACASTKYYNKSGFSASASTIINTGVEFTPAYSVCSDVTNLTTFQVDGFSGYAAGEASSNPTVTYSSVTPASPQPYATNVTWYVTYNKTSDGSFITGATCTLSIDGTAHAMTENADNYSYWNNSMSVASHSILASCSKATYDTSTNSSSYEITNIQTTLKISVSPASPQEYGANVSWTAWYNTTSLVAGATCKIAIDGTNYSMTENAANYSYWSNTLGLGEHTTNITCEKTNYVEKNVSSTYAITTIATELTTNVAPVSPQPYGTSVSFTAYFNRSSTNQKVAGASCNIQIDAVVYAMTEGADKYTYSNSSLPVGVNSWNVSCSKANYDSQSSVVDSYTISVVTTSLTILVTPTQPREYGTNVSWYAEYNSTSLVTGAECTINIDGTDYAMQENANNYSYWNNTLSVANHYWLVSCNKTNYQTKSSADYYNITNISTTLSLTHSPISPQEYGTTVTWYAKYNSTSFIPGATCEIDVDGSVYSMTENPTNYSYSTASLSVGPHSINVSCSKTNYNPSNTTDSFTITIIATTLSVQVAPAPPSEYGSPVQWDAWYNDTTLVPGASCNITLDGVQYAMSEDVSSYYYINDSMAVGAHSWNVSCSKANYQSKNVSSSYTITSIASSLTTNVTPATHSEYSQNVVWDAWFNSTANGTKIAGATCTISIDSDTYPMTEGATFYTYQNNSLIPGIKSINISCSKPNVDSKSSSSSFFVIYASTTLTTLVSPSSPSELGTNVTWKAWYNDSSTNNKLSGASCSIDIEGSVYPMIEKTNYYEYSDNTLSVGDNAWNITCSKLWYAVKTSITDLYTIEPVYMGLTVEATPTSPQEYGTTVTWHAFYNASDNNTKVQSATCTLSIDGIPHSMSESTYYYTYSTSSMSKATHSINVSCSKLDHETKSDVSSYSITDITTALTVIASPPSPQILGTNVTWTAWYNDSLGKVNSASCLASINGYVHVMTEDVDRYTYWNDTLSNGNNNILVSCSKANYQPQSDSSTYGINVLATNLSVTETPTPPSYQGTNITWKANYSSGSFITGAVCNITIDGTSHSMQEKVSSYDYSSNSLSVGNHSWQVSCSKTGYDSNTASDYYLVKGRLNVTVTANTSSPVLYSPSLNLSFSARVQNIFNASNLTGASCNISWNGVSSAMTESPAGKYNKSFTPVAASNNSYNVTCAKQFYDTNFTGTYYLVVYGVMNVTASTDKPSPQPPNMTDLFFTASLKDKYNASNVSGACTLHWDSSSFLMSTTCPSSQYCYNLTDVSKLVGGTHDWYVSCVATLYNSSFTSTKHFVITTPPAPNYLNMAVLIIILAIVITILMYATASASGITITAGMSGKAFLGMLALMMAALMILVAVMYFHINI